MSLPGPGSRGVESPLFRQLLGRFATGVTVITCRTVKGDPVGMTANSLASVSLEPPLVLVAVEKIHEMHAALESATHWVFNILAAEQEALSRRFAGAEPDRSPLQRFHLAISVTTASISASVSRYRAVCPFTMIEKISVPPIGRSM